MSQEPDSPNQLAEAIRRVADSAESEMDLQVKVEKLLDPFLPKIPGATLDRYGHATKLGGIKDALHGNLIIEYERPGKLAKRAGLDECLGQLRDYLTQEAQGHGKQASAALKRMVGVGLDGHVPYILWNASDGAPLHDDDFRVAFSKLRSTDLVAYPAISTQPTSPWINLPARAVGPVAKISGQSAYKGWVGACTWYNSIFWIRLLEMRPDGLVLFENLGDTGRAKAEVFKGSIEPDLVYPLLRGRDVSRWNSRPKAHLILTQDPKTRSGQPESWMKTHLPHTYQYLKRFEDPLRKRSGYKKFFAPTDPFYSIYNVGEYTLSPLKVCWAREDIALRAAVCGMGEGPDNESKPVVPDQTVMFVPIRDANEAHYLCAVLNSTPAVFLPKAYTTDMKLHVLSVIKVPKFNARLDIHVGLAELSTMAHSLAARIAQHPDDEHAKRKLAETEGEIDHAAAKLWGLTDSEQDEIRRALELLR